MTAPHVTEETPVAPHAVQRTSLRGVALRLLLMVLILLALSYGGSTVADWVRAHLGELRPALGRAFVVGALALFVVLLVLPFVPGMELGMALMMLLGPHGIGLVYGASVFAFALGFLVGRCFPLRLLAGLLDWLHLRQAAVLVRTMSPLLPEQRLALLLRRAPLRAVPFLLRHRYLAVAVAYNLPGNAIIGGGGGISLVAGMSGLFRLPLFVAMVAVAIAPLPLLILAQKLWG